MPCVEAKSRNWTVEIEARLAKPPGLIKEDGNICFMRGKVVPDSSRVKIEHYVPDSNSIPLATVTFNSSDPVWRTRFKRVRGPRIFFHGNVVYRIASSRDTDMSCFALPETPFIF